MTVDEWSEIVDWIEVRFGHGWSPDQAVALYQDHANKDASDVWQAIHRLYNEGRDFAPNGSVLAAKIREVRRENAMRERQGMGLPPPSGLWWSQYALETFGEQIPLAVAAERMHAAGEFCANPRHCKYHGAA